MYKEKSSRQAGSMSNLFFFFFWIPNNIKERLLLFQSAELCISSLLFFTFLLLLDGWIKWKESGSSSPSKPAWKRRKFFFSICVCWTRWTGLSFFLQKNALISLEKTFDSTRLSNGFRQDPTRFRLRTKACTIRFVSFFFPNDTRANNKTTAEKKKENWVAQQRPFSLSYVYSCTPIEVRKKKKKTSRCEKWNKKPHTKNRKREYKKRKRNIYIFLDVYNME